MSERALVVSFHDVAPHSQQACASFLQRMQAIGVDRVTLLVVPNWYDRTPIDHYPDFVAWLKQCVADGHEIQLHGYTHQAREIRGGLVDRWFGTVYTAREGEFQQLTHAEATSLLQQGNERFARADVSYEGFTAPAWLLGPEARKALVDQQIRYTTRWSTIDRLTDGLSVFAPTVVYSSRAAWRRTASLGWTRYWAYRNRNAPILRVAAHPVDLSFPAIEDSMRKRIEEALPTRTVMTYRDVVVRLETFV